MQKNKIDELTDEEVFKVYEDAIEQDSFEQHSGLMWYGSGCEFSAIVSPERA